MSTTTGESQPSSAAEPAVSLAPAAAPTRLAIAVPAGLVLLLACVLASTPAGNSDVWRHLATGRALLDGSYRFGTDPFAYTTEGVTWVNHSWLFDAVLY